MPIAQLPDTEPANTIKDTSPSEAEQAVAVISLAFATDPAARWTFPDALAYLTHFPAMVRAFGGPAFAQGTAYHVDGFAGAALWLPPGVEPDEETLVSIVQQAAPAERQADLFGVFERMGESHPTEPHWYLPLIGVDPMEQGKGHGAALLQRVLRRCDREGMLAYLESSNPANIPLYQRHGFRVIDTIQVGSSPPIFPMLRQAAISSVTNATRSATGTRGNSTSS